MTPPNKALSIPHSRVTLHDIAKHSGFACSTVSKALHNNPEIPEATRLQIQAIAVEMGYQRDPAITKLMQYLRNSRNKKHWEPIAFVSYEKEEDFRKNISFAEYLTGAEERSYQLGYQLQYFWMGDINYKHNRLSAILRTRGIKGVLLPPTPNLNTDFQIDWQEFATVSFGYSLRNPPGHRITNHQYHSMLRILQRLDEYGYRKIGFCYPNGTIGESRLNNNLSAALYVYQQHIPPENRIPPIRDFPINDKLLIDYIQKWQPDALISCDYNDLTILQDYGYKIPEDIGIAFINVRDPKSFHAGIDQHPRVIGASGVDLIAQQLYENQLGIPPHRKVVLIEGTWYDGQSVRKQLELKPSLNWVELLNP